MWYLFGGSEDAYVCSMCAHIFAWLNVSMFVRGTPYVVAFTLVSQFDSYWPPKLVVFLLAITAAMEEGSDYQ